MADRLQDSSTNTAERIEYRFVGKADHDLGPFCAVDDCRSLADNIYKDGPALCDEHALVWLSEERAALREQNRMPGGHDLAYANGVRQEREDTIADLERMLAVCEYAEVKAFIPLLINRLSKGLHRG